MSTAKKSLIGAGVGLMLLASAGGGGALYGHSLAQPEIESATTRADGLAADLSEARAASAEQVATLRAQLAQAERQSLLLEARRQLAIALDQIDARNFGLAQQRCQEASEALGAIEGADAVLSELGEELSAYRFELGGDFDLSRQQLRGFASRLDVLIHPAS